MPLLKNKKSLESILAKVAMTGIGKRVLSRVCNGCATVFVLHRAANVYNGINGHDTDDIERILIYFKKHKLNIVSLDQVVKAAQGLESLPANSVAFTLDDGYLDQLGIIAPIFVKHDVPLTIFLTSGMINGELWPWNAKIDWLIRQFRGDSLEIQFGLHCLKWPIATSQKRLSARRELQIIAANLSNEKMENFLEALESAAGIQAPETPPPEFAPSTWDQVRQLEKAGIRFAPHTHTHRVLSRLSEVEVRFELKRSMDIVKRETQHGLPILAYPVGMEAHFGQREMQIAESLGFSAAFSVCGDYARWKDSQVTSELRYKLMRFGFPCTVQEAVWFVSGLNALREGGRCIFNAHSRVIKNVGHRPIKQLNLSRTGFNALMRQTVYKLHLHLGRLSSFRCIQKRRIERFVFVCRGNVCRSPYAEVAAKSLGLLAVSCGTEVSRCVPAEMMAVHAALLRGHNLSEHISRSISDVHLVSSDCLVAMDPSHLPNVQKVAASVGCQVTLMSLWGGATAAGIWDPYGKSLPNFIQCFDMIDDCLAGLLTWFGTVQVERANFGNE